MRWAIDERWPSNIIVDLCMKLYQGINLFSYDCINVWSTSKQLTSILFATLVTLKKFIIQHLIKQMFYEELEYSKFSPEPYFILSPCDQPSSAWSSLPKSSRGSRGYRQPRETDSSSPAIAEACPRSSALLLDIHRSLGASRFCSPFAVLRGTFFPGSCGRRGHPLNLRTCTLFPQRNQPLLSKNLQTKAFDAPVALTAGAAPGLRLLPNRVTSGSPAETYSITKGSLIVRPLIKALHNV